MSRNFTETYSEIVESLQNKTLTITTIMVICSLSHTERIISIFPVSALQHGAEGTGEAYWK